MRRMLVYATFLTILIGCATSGPMQLTGLSGEQSPFLILIQMKFHEDLGTGTTGTLKKSSFIIYANDLKNYQMMQCELKLTKKEYLFRMRRSGPIDTAQSFSFGFHVREFPHYGNTLLWYGNLPDPKKDGATTAVEQSNQEGETIFLVRINSHILFENEEATKRFLRDSNDTIRKSDVHFGCYLAN